MCHFCELNPAEKGPLSGVLGGTTFAYPGAGELQ